MHEHHLASLPSLEQSLLGGEWRGIAQLIDLLSKVYEVLHSGTTYKIEKFNKMILCKMHKFVYSTSNFSQDINGFSQCAAYMGQIIV